MPLCGNFLWPGSFLEQLLPKWGTSIIATAMTSIPNKLQCKISEDLQRKQAELCVKTLLSVWQCALEVNSRSILERDIHKRILGSGRVCILWDSQCNSWLLGDHTGSGPRKEAKLFVALSARLVGNCLHSSSNVRGSCKVFGAQLTGIFLWNSFARASDQLFRSSKDLGFGTESTSVSCSVLEWWSEVRKHWWLLAGLSCLHIVICPPRAPEGSY